MINPSDVDDVGGDASANDISIETSAYHLGDIDVLDDPSVRRDVVVRASATTASATTEDDDDHDCDDDGASLEWEDFMLDYWRSFQSTDLAPDDDDATTTNIAALVRMEDTDMRPCEMEPELDDERNNVDDDGGGGLSRVRTGCIDMDMDVSLIADDIDINGGGLNDAECLSVAGRECSRAMASIAMSGGVRDMSGLRIDLGTAMVRRRRRDGLRGIAAFVAAEGGVDRAPVDASSPIYVEDDDDDDDGDDEDRDGDGDGDDEDRDGGGDVKSIASSSAGGGDIVIDASSYALALPLSSASAYESASSEGGRASSSTNVSNAAVAADWKRKTSPLPLPDMIFLTGPIMTRTSLRSLVMKKWNPSYWMQYGTHTLFVFRSKEHMDDWRDNPFHGKRERDFLVKLQVDFMDMMPVEGQQGQDGCHNVNGGRGGKDGGILGHRILPIKKKSYGKNDDEVYQFKLERWTNLGCSVLAAFASKEESEVQLLHNAMKDMLMRCPDNGLRNIEHMLK